MICVVVAEAAIQGTRIAGARQIIAGDPVEQVKDMAGGEVARIVLASF